MARPFQPYNKFNRGYTGRNYHVTVYLLHVSTAADDWPEKNLRQRVWVNVERAMEQLEDPGLRELVSQVTSGLQLPENKS